MAVLELIDHPLWGREGATVLDLLDRWGSREPTFPRLFFTSSRLIPPLGYNFQKKKPQLDVKKIMHFVIFHIKRAM